MTIKKLIIPDGKGNLKTKKVGKKKAEQKNQMVIPPGHSMFMLNTQDGKIYAMSIVFDISKHGYGRCEIKPQKGCMYTVAKDDKEAEKNFTEQINKLKQIQNEQRNKGKIIR